MQQSFTIRNGVIHPGHGFRVQEVSKSEVWLVADLNTAVQADDAVVRKSGGYGQTMPLPSPKGTKVKIVCRCKTGAGCYWTWVDQGIQCSKSPCDDCFMEIITVEGD